jgi:hypothetical protein
MVKTARMRERSYSQTCTALVLESGILPPPNHDYWFYFSLRETVLTYDFIRRNDE